MRAHVALLVMALVGSACVADLRSGVYGCPDGVCPEGQNCGTDGLCRDASDTRSGRYGVCASDADCYDGTCVLATGATFGVCSESCMTMSSACPIGDVCAPLNSPADGRCQASCADANDCGTDLTCLSTPTTQGAKSCFAARPEWSVGTPCMSNADCAAPEECAHPNVAGLETKGLCAWPCGAVADLCPSGDQCVAFSASWSFAAPFGRNLCLRRCMVDVECGVGSGLVCKPTMGPQGACVRPEWNL